jgi:hypothetical protein
MAVLVSASPAYLALWGQVGTGALSYVAVLTLPGGIRRDARTLLAARLALGSRLVEEYLAPGSTVRVIGHLRRGAYASLLIPPNLELFGLDLCGLKPTHEAFAGQDLVIHTAAMVGATTPYQQAVQRRVNVDEGTQRVIASRLRQGVPGLVHVITTAAIGISPNPRNSGGCSGTRHSAAERLVESYSAPTAVPSSPDGGSAKSSGTTHTACTDSVGSPPREIAETTHMPSGSIS